MCGFQSQVKGSNPITSSSGLNRRHTRSLQSFSPERALWLTWIHQLRNNDIAAALSVELCELIAPWRSRILRYLWCSYKTSIVLARRRPRFLFAQNPSLVLVILLLAYKPLFRYRLILDSHNAGLFPLEGRYAFLQALSRYFQRRADLNIVSNERLAEHVAASRGKSFVLPDPIPTIPDLAPLSLKGTKKILFICSFAADEPYREVFMAARHLIPHVHIYVSGDHTRVPLTIRQTVPPNVSFTGYVSDAEYVRYLRSVNAVLVLTEREDCLVRGAYEAVAAEKPMILSDHEVLRSFFGQHIVYTQNNAEQICKNILLALSKEDELRTHIGDLGERLRRQWAPKIEQLRQVLNEL